MPMIIGEVRRHLRDNNTIRVSRSLRDTAYKSIQTRARLMDELGHEPTIAQIAKELETEEAEIVLALDAIQDPVSLYEPIYHDDGDAIYVMDQIGDQKVSDSQWLDSIAIQAGINNLGERERRILKMRFFEGKTQMEVSCSIGISQAQVSRLEKNALKHMQKFV